MTIELSPDHQPLTAGSFERIKSREFVPERTLTGLKLFREKARSERDLRELYRGRAPYELLQNADDAGATTAVFSLASDGTAFAHNGRWFSVGNFRSLADGWSDKDPNECIGHKGLGFRSVLDLTPCPHLIQIEDTFLAIKFGWAINNNHIQQTLGLDHEAKALHSSWTQNGQRVCPVMGIPAMARKESLGGGLTVFNRFLQDRSLGLTTMFWLPAKDPDLPRGIADELSTEPMVSGLAGQKRLLDFLVKEVDVVLPFLASVRRILIMDGASRVGETILSVLSESTCTRTIRVTTDAPSNRVERDFFQMSLTCSIPPTIRNATGTPKAIRYLKDADLKLAVRIQGGEPVADPDARFQVYFPTEQLSGFGFLVHADFHVQPDRKYLVAGQYNSWLFRKAATFAANEFLSALLHSHVAHNVFSALAPTGKIGPKDGVFGVEFADALRARKAPFVPSKGGAVSIKEALLAPSSNSATFWESRFGQVIPNVCAGKKCLVASEHDELGSRAFLRFAGVEVAARELLIPLIEAAGGSGDNRKSSEWWYEAYLHLVNDEQLARSPRSFFVGRNLIPGSAGQLLAVPGEDGLLVCLHPEDKAHSQPVPPLFAKTFAFVDQELSLLLENGPDEISSWILSHFHISRFEASELIPRAIRSVTPRVFDGSLSAQCPDIILVWRFVKELVESSRFTFSDEFWATIGRLPVYSDSAEFADKSPNGPLIPCSAAYWPDELLPKSSSISGAESLRRIHPKFLLQLSDGQEGAPWREFLSRAGIGDRPKLLNYARLAVGGDELIAQKRKSENLQQFNGERQHDINLVVAGAVIDDRAWSSYIDSIPDCGHGVSRVIQSLSMIEGITDCCARAQKEFQENDQLWKERLDDLIFHFQANVDSQSADAIYCRGGRQGGHTISVPSFVVRQLAELSWLPSTGGPAGINNAFMRRASHKLISDTRAAENINDWLLPSVVIDDPELFLRLNRYGLAVLEDSTAHTDTLIRALKEIGLRLREKESSAWVFESPARWRAIRGAIQNVYRTLNQREHIDSQIRTVMFATAKRDQITFESLPLYFAEPGPIRDAFCGVLPLIDTDRVYAALFDAIGIVQLIPGLSVREEVIYQGQAQPNNVLQMEISEGLGPYLTALVRAKSDSQSDGQLTKRILSERFSVFSVEDLRVRFSLVAATNPQSVSSPPLPCYLQRRVIERGGAISEAHYTLFVSALPGAGILDVDADALGSAVVQMFQDRPTADITAMFARAAVRYKDLKGDHVAMKEFMYTHLGVSSEIMAAIEEEQLAELGNSDQDTSLPPPARLVGSPEAPQHSTLAQIVESKQDEIKHGAIDAVNRVVRSGGDTAMHSNDAPVGNLEYVTPEQRARGLAGEQEIERRLRRSCGWEGLFFLRDTRSEGCGYDYEAKHGERIVRLEVKTFTANGRVVVTNNELQAAALFKGDYYLIGVQHSESVPPSQWLTYMTQDPILRLISLGEFVVDAKLQVTACSLFDFRQSGSDAIQ